MFKRIFNKWIMGHLTYIFTRVYQYGRYKGILLLILRVKGASNGHFLRVFQVSRVSEVIIRVSGTLLKEG